MNLEDVYPVNNLRSKFDKEVTIEYYGLGDIGRIAELEPNCLHEIGANAWMHYVESGVKVNPQKLGVLPANHLDKKLNHFFPKKMKNA